MCSGSEFSFISHVCTSARCLRCTEAAYSRPDYAPLYFGTMSFTEISYNPLH